MSKSIKPEGLGAVSDVHLDDVVEVFKRIVKIIGDLRK